MKNIVYIATSLDGYIADENGGLEWLELVPNPSGDDMGFNQFISGIDAIVMGRNTYEVVLSFGIDWPYVKPVFVLSHSLKSIPDELTDKVEIITGNPKEITKLLNGRGYKNLYIDGGKTIQDFLRHDLISELYITTIPVLLGGGVRLFDTLPHHLEFSLKTSRVLLNQLVMSRYQRK